MGTCEQAWFTEGDEQPGEVANAAHEAIIEDEEQDENEERENKEEDDLSAELAVLHGISNRVTERKQEGGHH